MNRKLILIFILGFVVLTTIMIIIRVKSLSVKDYEIPASSVSGLSFRDRKQDLAEPDPVLNLPDINTMGEPVKFQNRVRNVIRGIKPLPIFPQTETVLYQKRLNSENTFFENLYKETNSDYILKEGSTYSNMDSSVKSEYDAGIKE